FLVISGFCIHQKLAAANAADAAAPMRLPFRRFWFRRFRRIYPPYLAAMLGSIVLLVASQLWLANSYSAAPIAANCHSLRWEIITHLLMIHTFFPVFLYGVLNAPFWSLGLEEHLYLLYSAFLWVRNRVGIWRVITLVAGVSLAWRLIALF